MLCFSTMFNLHGVDLTNESSRTQNASKADVIKLMEMLHVTEDINLQVKLFSVLAIHVVSNTSHKDEIIKSDALYEKVHKVLSRGLPLQRARALNLVSVLLHHDHDEPAMRARSLALRAQNALRTSGCLAIMTGLFTTTMLHQETWKALCQCLAESCRNSVENQSYCSHLVPVCVHKCINGSMEALLTLKSLVNYHTSNMNLFFESNGLLIFERKESLLSDGTMQLLSLIIEQAPKELLNPLYSVVFQNLGHYKQTYGTQTKIGQWATVNLYDINSRMKVTTKDTHVLSLNTNLKKTESKDIVNVKDTHNNDPIFDIGFLKTDDTVRLIQNVLREIHQFTTENNKQMLNKKAVNYEGQQPNMVLEMASIFKQGVQQGRENTFDDRNKYYEKEQIQPTGNEMSFSFLLKQKSLEMSVKSFERSLQSKLKIPKQNSLFTRIVTESNIKPHHASSLYSNSARKSIMYDNTSMLMDDDDDPCLLDFQPLLASTPKHTKRNETTSENLTRSTRLNRPSRKIYKKKEKHNNTFKQKENSKKHLTQRSISGRVFDAINESCTTFVKTFKNIFKTKASYDDNIQEDKTMRTIDNLESSCSYSFTNYMRKREAVLSRERTTYKNSYSDNNITKFCKTCNDTGNLKRKVVDDSYLKETVSKLKLGINLYGCDFKKISRAMWPRERYMTPEVLYKLYRKLIVK